jgi:hypothetical protein
VRPFLCCSSWDCASMATSGIRESTAKEATDRIDFFMETVLPLLQLCRCQWLVNSLSKGDEEITGASGLGVNERMVASTKSYESDPTSASSPAVVK